MDERLTQKQEKILEHLKNNKTRNVTSAVETLSNLLDCSESCIWNNINSLKRCGLVENEINKPVRLTVVSHLLLKNKGDKNE